MNGAALTESEKEGPDAGPDCTGPSGHLLRAGGLARSDAQGQHQVDADAR
jgi:hypothetical protein